MNARITTIIIVSAVTFISGNVSAKPRDKGSIMDAATRVLIRNQAGFRKSPMGYTPAKVLAQNPAYTVVGFEHGAYAIISNDDLLPEILGYSSTPFDLEKGNPSFEWWCRSITKVVEETAQQGVPAKIVRPDATMVAAEVPQLMSNTWGQMEPFNNLCPLEYNASGKVNGRCLVGCVATSATQVMHYHRYPAQGVGRHVNTQNSDARGNPTPLVVDLADFSYDYSKMKDSMSPGTYTEEEAREVAALAYTAGVTFGMMYGTGASGTYSDSAAVALREHFLFPDARLLVRGEHEEKEWMETVFKELNEGRPVLYSGADPWGTPGGGGHAFVFDGYDANGLVHVNWGWYGRNDGYYEVSLLNPRIHSFVNQQDMIIGVAPPGKNGSKDTTLKLTGVLSPSSLTAAVNKGMSEGVSILDLSEASLENGRLPQYAFHSSTFRTIILPAHTLSIGDGAFGRCRHLTEVVFPSPTDEQEYIVEDDIIYSRDGKTVIAVLPYYRNDRDVMTDYTSVLTFRAGVETIRPHAADGCFRVKGVEIPSTVKWIGEYAFANATNLKAVVVRSTEPPRVAAKAFSTLDPGYTRMYIPAGTMEQYYRAGEWNHFFTFDNVYEFGTNVKACNIVRRKGEANPELSYRIFGEYVSGEPDLTCDATPDSPTGDYIIKTGLGSLSGEDITLTDGVLRVVETSSLEVTGDGEEVFDVYGLDGRPVATGVTRTQKLDKGIYIFKGKNKTELLVIQ
jgi:putative thiol protease/hemagglutinin prtT